MRASVLVSLVSVFFAATTMAHPLHVSGTKTGAISGRDGDIELEAKAFMSDA